eukprot:COSAG01_NODE_7518_length_3169_cov_5.177524_6_plen_87_part_00
MSNVEKFEAGKSVAEDGDIQQMVAEGLGLPGEMVVTTYQYWVVMVAVRPRARQGQPLGGEASRGDAGWCGRVCGGPNLYSYTPSWS